MRTHLARLGKESLVYGLGSAAMRLAAIVTLPVYARVFAPPEIGALELVTVTYALLTMTLDFGLSSGFMRSYFDYDDDADDERRVIISTAFVVVALGCLLTTVLLVVLNGPIASLLFGTSARGDLVVLLGVLVAVAIPETFFLQVMRARFLPWQFLLTSLGVAVVTIVVGLVVVLGFDSGIGGILAGQVAGMAAGAAYGLWVVRDRLALRFSGSHLRTMLAYGLPFVPASAAFWVVAVIDRYMLRAFSNLAELGQYAIANRVTSVLPMAMVGFTAAYNPFILKLWSEDPDAERAVRGRTLTYMVVLISAIVVTFSLFAREIVWLIAPDFDRAYRAVGLVLIGAGAYGVCSITAAGMSLTRKTKWLMLFSGFGALVNVALNFVLIPPWGMLGAAAATAIAYAIISLLYYWKAQQLYPTPYEPRKILTTIGLALPVTAVGAVAFPTVGVALVVKVALLTAFGAALVALGVIEKRELRLARDRARGVLFRQPAADPTQPTA